jgi:hypothetical protein
MKADQILIELMKSHSYQFMKDLGVYETGQLFTFTLLRSIGSLVPVAIIVPIAYFLTMNRDLANDARASKEFLRIISTRLK